MKKLKKKFIYFIGAFISFLFSRNLTFGQNSFGDIDRRDVGPNYSVENINPAYWVGNFNPKETSLIEKIIWIILTPIFLILTSIVILLIWFYIFIKHKKRNVKKNS